MKTLHIIISGHVQGVSYRYYAKKKADELSITGSIRNKDDGTVEIYAQGPEESLNSFVGWCKEGSPESSVKSVDIAEINYRECTTFSYGY